MSSAESAAEKEEAGRALASLCRRRGIRRQVAMFRAPRPVVHTAPLLPAAFFDAFSHPLRRAVCRHSSMRAYAQGATRYVRGSAATVSSHIRFFFMITKSIIVGGDRAIADMPDRWKIFAIFDVSRREHSDDLPLEPRNARLYILIEIEMPHEAPR